MSRTRPFVRPSRCRPTIITEIGHSEEPPGPEDGRTLEVSYGGSVEFKSYRLCLELKEVLVLGGSEGQRVLLRWYVGRQVRSWGPQWELRKGNGVRLH